MTNQPGLKPYHNHFGFNLNGPSTIADCFLHSLLVNTCTGNLVLSVVDFATAGRTSPYIGRTYNSQNPNIDDPINNYVGGFGPGWTWIYDERIETNSVDPETASDGDYALFHDQTGGEHYFIYNLAKDTWVAPPGIQLTLDFDNANDQWQLLDEFLNEKRFDVDGKLLNIKVPDGSLLSFSYNTGNHQLTISETPGGTSGHLPRRIFLVTYDTADKYIQSIEIGPSGGSNNFSIYFSVNNNHLEGFKAIYDSTHFQWKYSYGGPGGRLSEIYDGNNTNSTSPKSTQISYFTQLNSPQMSLAQLKNTCFVRSIIDKSGAVTNFDWIFDSNTQKMKVVVTDPCGSTWTYNSKYSCSDAGDILILEDDDSLSSNLAITGDPSPQIAGRPIKLGISRIDSGEYTFNIQSEILSRPVEATTVSGETTVFGITFSFSGGSEGDSLIWIYPEFNLGVLIQAISPKSTSDDEAQPCRGHCHQINVNYS